MNTTIDVSPNGGTQRAAAIEWRHVAEIGSTNDELLAGEFGAEPKRPVVLRADRQVAGRGRRGRRWVSEPGAALTFSVALERRVRPGQAPLAGFSLAVGVALAEALVGDVPDLGLKWPNDLVRAGGKAGGILVETRREGGIERTVAGIGLNLLAPRIDADAAHPVDALVPTGLFERPGAFDADDIVKVLGTEKFIGWWYLDRQRSTASSAVIGFPSCQRTLSRRWKVSTVCSPSSRVFVVTVHDLASHGIVSSV